MESAGKEVTPDCWSCKCKGAAIRSGKNKWGLQMFVGGAYCVFCAGRMKEINDV